MSDTLIRTPTQLAPPEPPRTRRSPVPGLTVTVIVLALALIGLGTYVGIGAWSARSTANIVNDLAAAWSAPDGSGAVAADLYTPDAVLEVAEPGLQSQVQGTTEIIATVNSSIARDMVMTPGAMTRDGDVVTFHFTLGTAGESNPAIGVSTLQMSGALVQHQLIVVTGDTLWLNPLGTTANVPPANTSTPALEGPTVSAPNTSVNAVEGAVSFAGPETSVNAVEGPVDLTAPNTSTSAVEGPVTTGSAPNTSTNAVEGPSTSTVPNTSTNAVER